MRQVATKSDGRPSAVISVVERSPARRVGLTGKSATSDGAGLETETTSRVAEVTATSTSTLVGLRPTRRRQGPSAIGRMAARHSGPSQTTDGRIMGGLVRHAVSTTSRMASHSTSVVGEITGENVASLIRLGPNAFVARPAVESSESGQASSRVRGIMGRVAQSGPA